MALPVQMETVGLDDKFAFSQSVYDIFVRPAVPLLIASTRTVTGTDHRFAVSAIVFQHCLSLIHDLTIRRITS